MVVSRYSSCRYPFYNTLHSSVLIVCLFANMPNKKHYMYEKNNPVGLRHGLRTPNEGINQRNLKFWANVADKICFGSTYSIWDWDLIFSRAVMAISSPDVRSPWFWLEIVMNELRRFKHSADFLANSSHIIESAAISAL